MNNNKSIPEQNFSSIEHVAADGEIKNIAFIKPVKVIGKNVVFRNAVVADAEFILQLLNDPSFIKNIRDTGVRTVEEAGCYITNSAIASYEKNGFGLYLVELKDSKTPIGISGLVKRETLKDVDTGFAFLPRFWSKGYAVESSLGVLEYAKKIIKLNRLVAITSPANKASIKVLEKIGMKFESFIRLTEGVEEVKLFSISFG